MEKIIALDKKIFVFLNNLGSAPYDNFWLLITKQLHWTPFFFILAYLVYKKIGGKRLGILLLTIAVMLVFTDQITNLVKDSVQRLRPCNDIEIKHLIRIIKSSDTYSYFSGHASNSTASMTLLFLILRRYYNYTYLIFAFPLIFAYSRIYLGLHFPLDIITGYIFGALSGFIFYKLYEYITVKYATNS